ncbi:MAG: N-acetyl-alpha-D-glucosaminyl L-malate synthase BshA [Candidatus Ranarchaeia archaeon]
MRIGIVCHPTMGGSGFLATQLGLNLAKLGHEIHVITYETPFLLRDDKTGHMTVELVDCPSYPLFRHLPYTSALISKIVQSHKEQVFDVIHVHYAIPHALAAYMAREIAGTPYVVTLHGSDVHLLGIDPSFITCTQFTVQHANAITAVSQYLSEIAHDKMEITSTIHTIPNFVDCNLFRPKHQKRFFFKKDGELVISHVSNFRPVKRTLALIKAFAGVVKDVPNAKLLLVGDGPQRCLANRLAEKLGIKKHVKILGVRQDIPDILTESDVFVLPSKVEGCPLSILEAMSTGVPVVATQVGGIPEILEDKVQGYLVPLEDNQSLTDRLIELLQDPEKRHRMGRNGRMRVCSEFNSENVLPRYLAVYDDVIV